MLIMSLYLKFDKSRLTALLRNESMESVNVTFLDDVHVETPIPYKYGFAIAVMK